MAILRFILVMFLVLTANLSSASEAFNIANIKSSKPFIYFSPSSFESDKEMLVEALTMAYKKNNHYTVFIQINDSVSEKTKAEICRTIMKSGFSNHQIKMFGSETDKTVKIFLN